MGNFPPKNPDMDGYGSGRTGWSGVGLRILPREGLYRPVLTDVGIMETPGPVTLGLTPTEKLGWVLQGLMLVVLVLVTAVM